MGIKLAETVAPITFDDDAEISDYAKEAVAAMQRMGIVNGKPGNLFDPKNDTVRAEVAAMLHRFVLAIATDDAQPDPEIWEENKGFSNHN